MQNTGWWALKAVWKFNAEIKEATTVESNTTIYVKYRGFLNFVEVWQLLYPMQSWLWSCTLCPLVAGSSKPKKRKQKAHNQPTDTCPHTVSYIQPFIPWYFVAAIRWYQRSDSTGKPKGSQVLHLCAVGYCCTMTSPYQSDPFNSYVYPDT